MVSLCGYEPLRLRVFLCCDGEPFRLQAFLAMESLSGHKPFWQWTAFQTMDNIFGYKQMRAFLLQASLAFESLAGQSYGLRPSWPRAYVHALLNHNISFLVKAVSILATLAYTFLFSESSLAQCSLDNTSL